MQGISVGIGCFHFEVPSAKSGDDWAREVKAALEAIPSVRDVEIRGSFDLDYHSFFDPTDIYFDSHPTMGTLKFRLTIPNRLQNEVFPTADTHAEDFTIAIHYWDDFPVTFVTEAKSNPNTDASASVAIVREFLKREFKRLGGEAEKVHFSCVGPSPLHVDLKLIAADSQASDTSSPSTLGFSYETKAKMGYPTLTVRYDSAKYKKAEDALSSFVGATLDQLSYYYLMVRLRHRRLRATTSIANNTQGLIAVHETPGIRGWWGRIFKSGRLARELTLETISLGFEFDEERRLMKEHVEFHCEATDFPVFQSWLEEELLRDDYTEHFKNCREISDLLEPRRLREANVVLVVLVAILSAALGALSKQIFG